MLCSRLHKLMCNPSMAPTLLTLPCTLYLYLARLSYFLFRSAIYTNHDAFLNYSEMKRVVYNMSVSVQLGQPVATWVV